MLNAPDLLVTDNDLNAWPFAAIAQHQIKKSRLSGQLAQTPDVIANFHCVLIAGVQNWPCQPLLGASVIRSEQVHGTTVALGKRALLILGPSGSGKSSLALELMATGAALVSDDRTDLRREGHRIIASAPAAIAGRIEARGLGILRADYLPNAELTLIIDLGRHEDHRYPAAKQQFVLGLAFPLVFGPFRPHLFAAVRQCLIHGWSGYPDMLPTEGSELG